MAAIEGSLTLTVPVEVIGLSPDLQAIVSPITVDIIVAGPLIILDELSPEDFLVVFVDLPICPSASIKERLRSIYCLNRFYIKPSCQKRWK